MGFSGPVHALDGGRGGDKTIISFCFKSGNMEIPQDLRDRVEYCSRSHERLCGSLEKHHDTYCIMDINVATV